MEYIKGTPVRRLSGRPGGSRQRGPRAEPREVARELLDIRASMVAAARSVDLSAVHPNYRESARNLAHYLALRRRDLRPLQVRLAAMGLSSLGRAEAHVLASVDAVLSTLHRLGHARWEPPADEPEPLDFRGGERLLAEHTQALLGFSAPGRDVRIMVTMPSEAAHDYSLVYSLLKKGMNCMRINCAHDDAEAWLRMIEHLRRAEASLGRSCRVVMDLSGPKLRTGPIESGAQVLKIRPRRDAFGRVMAPARVWLTPGDAPADAPTAADAVLPVPTAWLDGISVGDRIRFRDARGASRSLRVVDVTTSGCWGEVRKTAYIVPGTILRRDDSEEGAATIASVRAPDNVIVLHTGDTLVVTPDTVPGRPASRDSAGRVLTPASIGCTIPSVLDDVRPGESVWFDDGRIGGVVERKEAARVHVRITHARPRGEKLRSDRGINLPETRLRIGALTEQDIRDLEFVAAHADVVELSFANSAGDVELLHEQLARLGARQPAVVVKVETRRGFENLPAMLLSAMRMPCCGVMIARGDLAVECGFERLAEVQEEILWICEAAHVPVIWATQVLENLARDGIPSRAEITDAAMGHRAECVMLNKGPHIVSAVRVLDGILRRMQTHQAKKRAMLRELRLAHTLR
jgi:pyruvate kinase